MGLGRMILLIICFINFANAAYKDPRKTYFEFDDEDEEEPPVESTDIPPSGKSTDIPPSGISTEKYEKCLYEKKNFCSYLKKFLRLVIEHSNRNYEVQTLTFDLTLTLAELSEIDNLLHSAKCNHELPVIFAGLHPRPLWKKIVYDELTTYIYQNLTLLGLIIMSLLVFLILVWWIHVSKSYFTAGVRMLLLAFILSVLVTFYRNYQKAFVKKYVKLREGIPLKCRPEDITWYQSLWSYCTGSLSVMPDECEEYFKAQMVDVLVENTIFEAIVETFSKSVLTPLPILFEYIAVAFKKLFQELPVYLWLPVSLTVIAFIFFQAFTQRRYRFHNYLLGTLEPTDNNRSLPSSNESVQMLQEANTHTPVTNLTDIPMGESGSCSLKVTGENIKLAVKPGSVVVEHGATHRSVEDLTIAEDHQEPKRFLKANKIQNETLAEHELKSSLSEHGATHRSVEDLTIAEDHQEPKRFLKANKIQNETLAEHELKSSLSEHGATHRSVEDLTIAEDHQELKRFIKANKTQNETLAEHELKSFLRKSNNGVNKILESSTSNDGNFIEEQLLQ